MRDVRVWLELSARERRPRDRELEGRRGGGHQPGDGAAPFSVRPDAWFVVRLSDVVLVGLVEVDRGTERGDRRWREKIEAYSILFESGGLPRVTGYRNARLLVLSHGVQRRNRLQALIETYAPPILASAAWLADQAEMETPDMTRAVWRRPHSDTLHALIPAERISGDRSPSNQQAL